ncbi:hypothetical protein Q3O60_13715, partial [Alkalimonas collagenimarina]
FRNPEEFNDDAVIRGQDVKLIFRDNGLWYHSFSASRDIAGFDVTLGIANAFDQKPPRVSDFGGVVRREGSSAFYSQYDWTGRRAFLTVSYDF